MNIDLHALMFLFACKHIHTRSPEHSWHCFIRLSSHVFYLHVFSPLKLFLVAFLCPCLAFDAFELYFSIWMSVCLDCSSLSSPHLLIDVYIYVVKWTTTARPSQLPARLDWFYSHLKCIILCQWWDVQKTWQIRGSTVSEATIPGVNKTERLQRSLSFM